jgi:hypothetical protein
MWKHHSIIPITVLDRLEESGVLHPQYEMISAISLSPSDISEAYILTFVKGFNLPLSVTLFYLYNQTQNLLEHGMMLKNLLYP